MNTSDYSTGPLVTYWRLFACYLCGMLSGGVASTLVAHYTGEQHNVFYAFITGIAGTIGVAVGVWWEIGRVRPKADSSRRLLLVFSGALLIITFGHASIGLSEMADRAEALSVMREISEGGATSIALQRQSTAEYDAEVLRSPDALRDFAEACSRFVIVEYNVGRRHYDTRYVLAVDTGQGVARLKCGYNLPSGSPVEGIVYGWGAENYSPNAFFMSSDLRRWFERYVDGN
jgi:hypothetical protein